MLEVPAASSAVSALLCHLLSYCTRHVQRGRTCSPHLHSKENKPPLLTKVSATSYFSPDCCKLVSAPCVLTPTNKLQEVWLYPRCVHDPLLYFFTISYIFFHTGDILIAHWYKANLHPAHHYKTINYL